MVKRRALQSDGGAGCRCVEGDVLQHWSFHVPTWVSAAALINAALAVALLFGVRAQHPALRGSLGIWASGALLLAVGWSLIAFRDVLSSLVSVLISNALIALGMARYGRALRRFRSVSQRDPMVLLLVAAVIAVSWYAGIYAPDRYLRLTANTLFLALIFGLVAREAFACRSSLPAESRSHWLVAGILGATALALATRALVVAWLGPDRMPAVNEVGPLQISFFSLAALGPAVATLGFALMCNDRLALELVRLSERDPLTGLFNRRKIEEWGRELVPSGAPAQTPMAVILIDLDRFKSINDGYGHATGDRVLKAAAAILQKTADTYGAYAGRWGGEEMVLLLPGASPAKAVQVAEQVRQAAEDCQDAAVRWTLSAGVADARPEDRDFESVFNRADAALYQAKAAGRNTVRAARAIRNAI